MFNEFFMTMRVAWVVSQISARHRLERPLALAYHHPLVDTLVDELNGSVGVFVHWGVYESGKSTAVREAAWRLQENAKNQVIKLQSFDFHVNQPIQQELRRLIGVPKDMSDKPISKFFIQPDTTLVIDHADQLMRDKDRRGDEMLEMVLELIKESEATNKFNVLLVVNSWERAQELVDAGCKLVPSGASARWTREQLEALYGTLSDKAKDRVGGKKDELLRLATLSGTPGFLTYEINVDSKHFGSRHAAMHDLEWHKGIKALYNPQQELPEWCSGSPAGIIMDEGRFPDRNGIYHHADLARLPAYLSSACQAVA
jgi:hypothetical protein